MRNNRINIIAVVLGLFLCSQVYGQKYELNKNPYQLPNGWKISAIGETSKMGDLPMQLVVHPSKKWMVGINAGQSNQSLMVYDCKTGNRTDSVSINKTFYGGVFNSNGKDFYVNGGNNNWIEHFAFSKGKLKLVDTIFLGKPWPVKISPVGICLDKKNEFLYTTTKEDSAIYQINLKTKKAKIFAKINSEGYSIIFDDKHNLLWVSEWGNSSIAAFDIASGLLKNRIKVGSNPNEMILDKKSNRIFVTCGNDNSVHVVSTEENIAKEILNTAIYPSSPTGSTPNGLDIDNTKGILFVANADNNNLALFDIREIGETKIIGFVPTGWYPTQVKVVSGQVFVSNGKGLISMANPRGPSPLYRKNSAEYQKGIKSSPVQYIGGLFKGVLQKFSVDFMLTNLPTLTEQVKLNTPYNSGQLLGDIEIPEKNPIPSKIGQTSPIKHVFYIIKENRTYDQVLGDVAGGNGDTSLLLFGENITPNQHKLVKEFVLLDNFYVDAEVSADGHNWSTAAIANDYTEKTWPISYGGRGGNYVYEGQSKVAHPDKGFIWDHAKRANISFRTYGEFADDYKPNIKVLENHLCPHFTSWDEKVRDTSRFYQWKSDFDSLININQVPQLSTLRFINDHTEGVRKNRPTPFAHIADNDLAVGMFVEYLSKSKIWESSVVFILEDDAQNGADHVDAHRSTAYLAGGYVKRNFIDHNSYSTSSMLRTMELILGMSPMSQYDAASKSMWRCFNDTSNNEIFNAVPAKVDLNEKNASTNSKSTSFLMHESEKLDLDKEDLADEQLMNSLLWKYVKGEHAIPPAIKRIGFK